MNTIFKAIAFAFLGGFAVSMAATTYGPISIEEVQTTVQHNGMDKDTTLLRAVINGNSDEALSIPEDVVVSQVVIRRKFEAGKPQTVVLPFSIPQQSWRAQPLKFWRYAGMLDQGDGNLQFWTKGYSGDIDANTPFVVIADNTVDSIVFNLSWYDGNQYGNVTLNTTKGGNMVVSYDNWKFVGTYSRIDWTEGHPDLGCVYGFAAKDKDGITVGQFVKAKIKEGSTTHPYIRPMRGYLFYDSKTVAAKRAAAKTTASSEETGIITVDSLPQTIELIFDDSDSTGVMGIGRMNTITGEMTVDRWVDMKGRKLDKKPTTKGVYYNNRKKVIIK